MSTRTDHDAPTIHRRLWAAKTLRDGRVIYWWLEMLAIGLFYIVYSGVRNADKAKTAEAFHHARQIMDWQRSLGINHEQTINEWSLHFTPLVVAANYFYGSLHFVVTIGVGIFLFRKWPDDYPRWRNTLGIATAIALIGFRFWPLMPPRLLPADYGFVDTLAKYPTLWTFNSGAMKNISNQFAAMPSVHCCWALWCACALVPRLKRTWAKILAGLYPALTVSVIVITANHYLLDAVGGFIIFGIGYVVARLVTRAGRGPAITPAATRAHMIDLDHVAIATTDIEATLGALVGDLGGTIFSGGDGYGFRWVQVRLGDGADGMTVEVLVEWEPARNDFLARFLARHGPGQHHLTFKVTDLAATLQRVRSAGFEPVSVDLSDPHWKEAFLQPRQAHGTVVQLAQVHDDHPGTAEMVAAALQGETYFEPEWWPSPPPPAADHAVARRLVLGTPSLPAAVGFFAGLLEGDVVAEDDTAVELAWPGGGRIRLELDADGTPGFRRIDGDHAGAPMTRTVSGAPFVLSTR